MTTATPLLQSALGPIPAPRKFWVTAFRGLTDPKPHEAKEVSGPGLVRLFTQFRTVPEKAAVPLVAPYRLHEGAKRSSEGVAAVSCLGIDCDQGDPLAVDAALAETGLAYIIHSTHSHTADAPRFRVIVPLARDIGPSEHPNVWAFANSLIGGIGDKNARDVARGYFLPSSPAATAGYRIAIHRSGDWLDPRIVPRAIADLPHKSPATLNSDLTARPLPGSLTVNWDEVGEALACIGADERETWLKVGMGLHSTGREEAREVWDRWSQKSAKFDTADQDRTWTSFKPDGGVSIATLLHIAEQNGYVRKDATDALPGDIINGKVFARMFRGRLLYVYSRGKWLAWDGSRYVWCGTGEEMQCAKEAAAMIVKLAGEALAKDPERNKRRMLDAMASQRLPRLDAMVGLAQSEKGMGIASEGGLDADPFLLGCRNGVVDLRTGGLLQPDPKMLITRQCHAEYHRGAACPRWLRFLNEVFDGDAEHIAYVQRFFGYMLTGCVDEEVMVFAFGHGANGKSVFCNVLRGILGDYAVTGQATMLSKRKGDEGPRNDVARLAGARAIFANETQSGDRFDEQLIKTLVSRDPIAARYLHKEFFEFAPTGKLIVCGNHRPAIVGTDTGIWRRVHLWLFERTFSEEERDPGLERELLEERDGILIWGVEGAMLRQRHRLGISDKVRRATRQYRDESDILGEWLETECVTGADRKVSQRQAYSNYALWCRESGVSSPSKKTFTRQLRERRFSDAGFIGRDRAYTGFDLKGATPPTGAGSHSQHSQD